ncbi:MAG: hypothetical protein WBE90_26340 [Xanthobacteraceae bacterium]
MTFKHHRGRFPQLLHELKIRDYNVVHVVEGSAREAAAQAQ